MNRIALLASLAVLVAAAGTALAGRAPRAADEPAHLAASQAAEPQTDADADDADGTVHARERLAQAGIEVDADAFDEHATRYGVGGAVRLFAWSDETGLSVEALAAMRDGEADGEPVGWGRLARELGVHPGLGSIMGRGNAPDEPPGRGGPPDHAGDD